jgi:hypothetical protein
MNLLNHEEPFPRAIHAGVQNFTDLSTRRWARLVRHVTREHSRRLLRDRTDLAQRVHAYRGRHGRLVRVVRSETLPWNEALVEQKCPLDD